MKNLTRWLVAKTVRNYQSINDLKARAGYGALEGWPSIVVNARLFAVKMMLGLAVGSVSLIAEAITAIVSDDGRVNAFHDLGTMGCRANRCNVVFDIALPADAGEQQTHDIVRSIWEKFTERFPDMRTTIKAGPRYAYSPVVAAEKGHTR